MSINEELGQIEYILTDKTGTLTCNRMEFKNAIIGNNVYGEDIHMKDIDAKFDYSRLTHRSTKSNQPEKVFFDSKGINYTLSGEVMGGEESIKSHDSHKK